EARDITGLDYLRARYYDSRAGIFLTEDSYAGQATDPLSQNRYAYVHNNPVNYTDPSGHFWNKLWKGAKKFGNNLWNGAKKLYHKAERFVGNTIDSAIHLGKKVVNWVGNQATNAKNWAVQQWNNFTQTPVYQAAQRTYQGASTYVEQKYQQVTQTANNAWEEAKSTGQSVYNWGVSKSKEAANIARNWTKSLEETIRHVCTTADRVGKQTMNFLKKVDWKKVITDAVSATNNVTDVLGIATDVSDGLGLASKAMRTAQQFFKPFVHSIKHGVSVDRTSATYRLGAQFTKAGKFLSKASKFFNHPVTKVATFGLQVWDSVNQGETFGQALVHTAGSAVATGAGYALGAAAVGVGAAVAGVTAPAWVPIVAGTAAAIGVGLWFDKMYQDKKSLLRTGIDGFGKIIDGIDHYDGKEPIPPLKKEPLIPLPPNY
ncbi:RHS repeat-associated core domain-containing protein, partial [Streptococcus sp. 19428wC2_LYSM12]